MVVTALEWFDAAACRNSERTLFYSADGSERKEDRLARELMAKRICSNCSVRELCLESALARHESYGIWGGMNEYERRSLLRN